MHKHLSTTSTTSGTTSCAGHARGPRRLGTGDDPVLAYTFGLRHAFDADHLAAVDNTTRKLMADNAAREVEGTPPDEIRKPLSVGFWFSLGHSTIVFGLAFLLSVGVKTLAGQVEDDGSSLHNVTGVIGASMSGAFLWILGILNFVVLLGIIRVFREMRDGHLPILFAAGMCLMDTVDGVFMNVAYGSAFARPVRKVFYNITITTISIIVALVIGTVELIGVLADQADITSGPLAAIADIPLDYAGYAIVGLFVLSWIVALAVWRFGHIEEKWSANLAPRPTVD